MNIPPNGKITEDEAWVSLYIQPSGHSVLVLPSSRCEVDMDDNFEIMLALLAQFGGSLPTQSEVKASLSLGIWRIGCVLFLFSLARL